MSAHTLFRDRAAWERKAGPAEYGGHRNLHPPEYIAVRDVGTQLVELGGDTVHRHIWWVLPEHAVRPGDYLSGAEVREMAGEAKDGAGNVIYRVIYGAE